MFKIGADVLLLDRTRGPNRCRRRDPPKVRSKDVHRKVPELKVREKDVEVGARKEGGGSLIRSVTVWINAQLNPQRRPGRRRSRRERKKNVRELIGSLLLG